MTTLTTPAPTRPSDVDVPPVPRRRPFALLRHSATLTWRSLLQIKHSPEQFADLTLQPIMFIVLFVFLFGGAVSGDWREYLQYVLPGILVQTVVFAAQGTGVGLNTDITKGVFDRFRSLPIARSAPLIGAVVGDVVRYVVSLTMVLGFGAILGFRIHTGVVPTLAACGLVLLFAMAICWIGAFLGMLVKTPQSVQVFGFLFMFPLTFGSNIFVPSATMPGWLRAWVDVNPVSKLVTATRGLLLGGPVAEAVLYTLAWTAAITAVFAPLAVFFYRRKA